MQEKLLIERKKRNISQETLAKLINVTTKQYGLKERGKNAFKGDEMFTIAKYFGLNVDDLFMPINH